MIKKLRNAAIAATILQALGIQIHVVHDFVVNPWKASRTRCCLTIAGA